MDDDCKIKNGNRCICIVFAIIALIGIIICVGLLSDAPNTYLKLLNNVLIVLLFLGTLGISGYYLVQLWNAGCQSSLDLLKYKTEKEQANENKAFRLKNETLPVIIDQFTKLIAESNSTQRNTALKELIEIMKSFSDRQDMTEETEEVQVAAE